MPKIIFTVALTLIASLCFGQWLIDEDFEDLTTLPAGWTVHDDGDGLAWRNLANASHAHSGTRSVFCDNYLPNQNEDWLITPQLSISAGDSLKFYTRSWVSEEDLEVWVSTTGTGIDDFDSQILFLQGIGEYYQSASCDLSSFAGQDIHVGFVWHCDTYGILVDDIRIGQPQIIQPELVLPDSFSFIQGESLNVDFTPYVTCTDIGSATLSVSGNVNITVLIDALEVTFSSPDFNDSETLEFTLTDNISGLTDTDQVVVEVLPPPVFDLAVIQILSPRDHEFQDHAFTPAVSVQNVGLVNFDSVLNVTCEIEDGQDVVYSGSAYENVFLEPGEAIEISMPEDFTPVSEGVYTATFQVLVDDNNPANDVLSKVFEVVYRVTQGGPDAFGYSFIDSNDASGPVYEWIDISDTGNSSVMYNVDAWGGDDNFSEPVPIGFSFPFYGIDYTQMYIDTNGEILLEDNTWYEEFPDPGWDSDGNMFNYMYPIPGYTQMPALIAVYWDDLIAPEGISDVYFQTFGEAPERYCVVQWDNLRFYAGTGGTPQLKFQVILYENGEFLMQYHTAQTGQTGSTVPHQNGLSATVAIQNASADIGLCYVQEIVVDNTYQGIEPAGNILHDELAIRFYNAEDLQPPILSHDEPGNTFNTDPLLSVNALDLSDITEVTLHYDAGGGWQTMPPTAQEGSDYLFQLPELPLGTELEYYFSALDEPGNDGTLPEDAPTSAFSFRILPSPEKEILIVYSGSQDYQLAELPVYEGLLDELGADYDVYDWEEYPSYRFPAQYDIILCYATARGTGSQADTLSLALQEFLDLGATDQPRNLFFSSDAYAADTHALPNSNPRKKLFNAYFRSYYVATGSGGGTNGLGGPDSHVYEDGSILCLSSSPIGEPTAEYPVYANSPDCIFRFEECPDWYADEVQYPDIGALNAFAFEDGPFGGQAYLYHGVCATSVELPVYKAFYFSFDYSQLTQQAQRLELMTDLLDWFGWEPVSAPEENTPIPRTAILGNYPNPFNPSTTISFSLRESVPAKLEIYNLRGQKVKTLVDGPLAIGRHSAVWDGRDEGGSPVSSAVYFVRLKAGGENVLRKIMLTK